MFKKYLYFNLQYYMFVDYKLFLILILSLVLLYTYNRVESLKLDVKKIQHKLDKSNDCIDDKCKFTKNNDIETEINKFKELLEKDSKNLDDYPLSDKQLDNTQNFAKSRTNDEDLLNNNLEELLNLDDKDIKLLEKDKNILNEKNTTEFSATDNDLNDEYSNESSDNIIIYSNSQSDKKKDKNLQNDENEKDSVENLIDKIQDKPVIINIQDNQNEVFEFNKDSVLDLDYEVNSDKNKVSAKDNVNLDQVDNILAINNILPEINIENLKDISSYKLKELQDLAEKKNINIISEINGKKKNKTKKELYLEINNIN